MARFASDVSARVRQDRTVAEAVRKAKLAVRNDPTIPGLGDFQAIGTTVTRTILSKLQDTINAADYGVIGDGATDDTAAVQAALTAGQSQNKVVFFGGLVCKITSALTMAGPGLVFDAVPHGSSGGPGFLLTGSGYTALTVTGRPQAFAASFYGTLNTMNGVLFSNPQDAVVQHVRVYNLDGYGVKLSQMYDCLFETISVELCGNATEYAFSIVPGADTSNMSHILRLQVEQSNKQAIFVDPTTLSCVIDNIHSERLTPDATKTNWSLGGARCIYQAMRIHSSGTSANATLLLSGEHTQYNGVAVEGNIVVKAEGATASAITITDPNIAGTFKNVPNQTGVIAIMGGEITTFTADPLGLRVFATKITALDIEVGLNPIDATQARFEDCDITTLVAPTSALSAATFVNCRIGEGNNLLKGMTILIGCQVTFAGTCTVQGPLLAYGTRFIGNVTPNGYAAFDDGCYCTGTVTGPGPPTQGTFPGIRGMTSKNLLPSAGGDIGWVCTLAGGPGTWTTRGGGTLSKTLTFGTHFTGGNFDGSANITEQLDATNLNTASTIVARGAGSGFAMGQLTCTGVIATGAVSVAVAAGGAGLIMDAATGTANTGMQTQHARGGAVKWQVGTAVSVGADAFEIYDSVGAVSALQIASNGGQAAFGAPFKVKGYTVATLPAGVQGYVAYCTDLLAPGFLVAAVGGGAVVGPVFYNGAAWVAF